MGAALELPEPCTPCKATPRAGLPARGAAGRQLLVSHRVCADLLSLADTESYAALPLRGKTLAMLHFQCYLLSLFRSSHCFTNDINSCNGD